MRITNLLPVSPLFEAQPTAMAAMAEEQPIPPVAEADPAIAIADPDITIPPATSRCRPPRRALGMDPLLHPALQGGPHRDIATALGIRYPMLVEAVLQFQRIHNIEAAPKRITLHEREGYYLLFRYGQTGKYVLLRQTGPGTAEPLFFRLFEDARRCYYDGRYLTYGQLGITECLPEGILLVDRAGNPSVLSPEAKGRWDTRPNRELYFPTSGLYFIPGPSLSTDEPDAQNIFDSIEVAPNELFGVEAIFSDIGTFVGMNPGKFILLLKRNGGSEPLRNRIFNALSVATDTYGRAYPLEPGKLGLGHQIVGIPRPPRDFGMGFDGSGDPANLLASVAAPDGRRLLRRTEILELAEKHILPVSHDLNWPTGIHPLGNPLVVALPTMHRVKMFAQYLRIHSGERQLELQIEIEAKRMDDFTARRNALIALLDHVPFEALRAAMKIQAFLGEAEGYYGIRKMGHADLVDGTIAVFAFALEPNDRRILKTIRHELGHLVHGLSPAHRALSLLAILATGEDDLHLYEDRSLFTAGYARAQWMEHMAEAAGLYFDSDKRGELIAAAPWIARALRMMMTREPKF